MSDRRATGRTRLVEDRPNWLRRLFGGKRLVYVQWQSVESSKVVTIDDRGICPVPSYEWHNLTMDEVTQSDARFMMTLTAEPLPASASAAHEEGRP